MEENKTLQWQLVGEELNRFILNFAQRPRYTDWHFDKDKIFECRSMVWNDVMLAWDFKAIRFEEYYGMSEEVYIYPIIETRDNIRYLIVADKEEQRGYCVEYNKPLYSTPKLGKPNNSFVEAIWTSVSILLFIYGLGFYKIGSPRTLLIFLFAFIALYIEFIAIYQVMKAYANCCKQENLNIFSMIKMRLRSLESHGNPAKIFFYYLIVISIVGLNFFLEEQGMVFFCIFILLLVGGMIIAIRMCFPYERDDFFSEKKIKTSNEQTIHYSIASSVTILIFFVTRFYSGVNYWCFVSSEIILRNNRVIDLLDYPLLCIVFIMLKILLWFIFPGFFIGGFVRGVLSYKRKKNKSTSCEYK